MDKDGKKNTNATWISHSTFKTQEGYRTNMVNYDYINNDIDGATQKTQRKQKPAFDKMGPFQKRFDEINLIIVTAGPRGEFSKSVCKWVDQLATGYAKSKCDDSTPEEIKSRFAAKVRTDCYTELHYTSIFGEAASTLEALEFHCSGQSAGTVQHLTDKNAASKQTGPAAVGALEGDDDDNNGINDNEFASMAEHAYPSWQGKFDSEDEDGEENGYTVSSKDSQEAEPAVVVIDGSSGSDSEDAGALPL